MAPPPPVPARSRRPRKQAWAAAALALLTASSMLAMQSASARAPEGATGKPTAIVRSLTAPKTALPGEKARVLGAVSSKAGTPVTVEVKTKRTWKQVASTAAKKGTFKTRARMPSKPGRYQLRAYTTSPSRAVTRPVTVKKQTATLEIADGPVFAGAYTDAVVTTRPPMARRVVVEAQNGGAWTRVGAARTNRRGTTDVVLTAPTVGATALRAVALPVRRSRPAVSKTTTVAVKQEPLVVGADTVVVDGADASTVSGYDRYTGTLTFDTTSLPGGATIGSHLVLPPGPGFPSGLARTVTGVTRTADGLVVSTRQASFSEIFESIPASRASMNLVLEDATIRDLSDGVTCTNCAQRRAHSPAARRAAADLPGFALAVSKDIPFAGSMIEIRGDIGAQSVATGDVDVSLHWSGPRVDRYTLEAGIDFTSGLSAKWSRSAATDGDQERTEIASIDGTFKGAIGPVPIWVDVTVALFIDISASGEITLFSEITNDGTIRGGIKGDAAESRGLMPAPYFDNEFATTVTRTIEANGEARAAAGGELAIDIYSVGGPRTEAGWQAEAEIDLNNTNETGDLVLTCLLTHGPFINVSLGLNEDLADLLEIDNYSVGPWEADLEQYPLYECPDGTNPPEVETTSLPEATVGSFYLAQLGLTDKVDRDGTWTLRGGFTLPDGLSLQTHGSIVGTPARGTAASYTVPVKFTDERGRVATADLVLLITAPDNPEIATTSLPGAAVGDAYSAQVRLTQETERDGTWGLRGTFALPRGLTFSAAGILSGTPASNTEGSYTLPVRFTDARKRVATADLNLTIRTAGPPKDCADTPGCVVASSQVGDAWSDSTGAKGEAVLSFGHQGCPELTPDDECVGGSWATVEGGKWIWKTRDGDTSSTTFAKTFTASTTMTLSCTFNYAVDATMTVELDGRPAFSGETLEGWDRAQVRQLTLSPGAHTLTMNVGDYGSSPTGVTWAVRDCAPDTCSPQIDMVDWPRGGPNSVVTISGRCFGPPPADLNGDDNLTAHLLLDNKSRDNWHACWSGDPDLVGCFVEWSPQRIVINGFDSDYGSAWWEMKAGDEVDVHVWSSRTPTPQITSTHAVCAVVVGQVSGPCR